MFLHIMVSQNPKKPNAKEITFFDFIECNVIIHLCNLYMSQHTKKCKYPQEMIEMICNLYEICSIY
jgi:hypothetical protein